jgi:hypothetical protein
MSQSARRPARRAPSGHGAWATSSGGAGAETTKHPPVATVGDFGCVVSEGRRGT